MLAPDLGGALLVDGYLSAVPKFELSGVILSSSLLSHLDVTLHLVFRAVNLLCCAVEWMRPTLPALTALYPLM